MAPATAATNPTISEIFPPNISRPRMSKPVVVGARAGARLPAGRCSGRVQDAVLGVGLVGVVEDGPTQQNSTMNDDDDQADHGQLVLDEDPADLPRPAPAGAPSPPSGPGGQRPSRPSRGAPIGTAGTGPGLEARSPGPARVERHWPSGVADSGSSGRPRRRGCRPGVSRPRWRWWPPTWSRAARGCRSWSAAFTVRKPHPRIVEHRLGDDGPAHDGRDGQSEQRDDRDEGVAQRVAVEHPAGPAPLARAVRT